MSKTVKMDAPLQDQVTLNIDRFPFLKKLISETKHLGNYIVLLEEKKSILLNRQKVKKNGARNLSDVNLDIEIVELSNKIAKRKQNLHDRQTEVSSYHNQVAEFLPEVEEKYNEVREKAMLVANTQPDFPDMIRLKEEIEIGNENSKDFETNWEMKMRHYLELKQILYPKQESAATPE